MLRALLTAAVLVGLVGSAAYVVAMSTGGESRLPNDHPDDPLVEADTSQGAPTGARELSGEVPLVEEARVPFPPRNVTPPGVYTGPVRRYEAPVTDEPPAAEPPIATRNFRRVVVEEAGLLTAGGTRIRLADITAPDPDATCSDAGGGKWPCGRRAMAALRLLLRHRPVECEVTGEEAEELLARCRVGNRDIAAWLVDQGWAEPAGSARYQAEFEAARDGERGMFEAAQQAAPPVSIPTSGTAATAD